MNGSACRSGVPLYAGSGDRSGQSAAIAKPLCGVPDLRSHVSLTDFAILAS